MAAFFNPKATLDAELAEYFGGFQQVVSYLYDPDGFFSGNLRRCGVKNLIEASPKIDPEGEHASRQLARPLESLALYLDAAGGPPLRPGEAEIEFARDFFARGGAGDVEARPLVAIHPGSGGERKNWPPELWRELGLGNAQLVFNPSATKPGLSNRLWELEQPAAAAANQYFVAANNRIGHEVAEFGPDAPHFYGSSYFVDPRGNYVGEIASEDKEETVTRDLDFDLITTVRNDWQFYRDRRPDSYELVTKP